MCAPRYGFVNIGLVVSPISLPPIPGNNQAVAVVQPGYAGNHVDVGLTGVVQAYLVLPYYHGRGYLIQVLVCAIIGYDEHFLAIPQLLRNFG